MARGFSGKEKEVMRFGKRKQNNLHPNHGSKEMPTGLEKSLKKEMGL